MQWFSAFGSGQRTPERTLTLGTSPALTMEAQWIGWQAVIRWRFWPRMAERCADQEDLEHGDLRFMGSPGRVVATQWRLMRTRIGV